MNIKNKLSNPKLLVNSIVRNLNVYTTKLLIKILNITNYIKDNKANDEFIIVSMTSWKKRIGNVDKVVRTILDNSLVPDKIVCNLSTDEFPLREMELPKSLLELRDNTVFEINWVKENTKAFKKFIPILKKYPNDVIITIDDDFLYPNDFIETFYKRHLEKPHTPLSGNNVIIDYANFHCGCASLVKSIYFGKYIEMFLDEKVTNYIADDVFYTYCAAMNGYYYENVGKEFFLNMPVISPIEPMSETEGLDVDNMKALMKDKIKSKYGIDISNIKKPKLSLKK